MTLNRLLRPETPRDKWLRTAITGAGAALALIIAIILFATAGDDDNGSGNNGVPGMPPDMVSPGASDWKSVDGTVTKTRQHDIEDEDGNVTDTVWFVTYEYTADEYYIREEQLAENPFEVGDTVTVYYAPENARNSTLIKPGTSTVAAGGRDSGADDEGGGSTGGIILMIVAGLLAVLTAAQIVDLRRDAMGPAQ